jgi:ATP-binding cassette subfamily B protein
VPRPWGDFGTTSAGAVERSSIFAGLVLAVSPGREPRGGAAVPAPQIWRLFAVSAFGLGARLGLDATRAAHPAHRGRVRRRRAVTGVIRITLLWASTRLAFATGADLSRQIYRRTLYQPYQVHVYRNSSEVISGITQKVTAVIDGLNNVLVFISSLLILLAVTTALLMINPVVALIATAGFGASYGAIAFFSRHKLRRYSQRISNDQTHLIKALQEGLGGIRDVLLDGTQPLYCTIYSRADLRLRRAQGNTLFISSSPRFAMESVGMVLIAALAYGLSNQPGGVREAIPTLGVLAMGAQRVLPVLQQLYSSWATIVGRHASITEAIELLEQPLPPDVDGPEPQPLVMQQAIEFRDVRFRYSPDGPWVLNGLDLTIPQGARVGFVGSTGSGKSTTIDLLMGLLTPASGAVLVDNEALVGQRVRAWRRACARRHRARAHRHGKGAPRRRWPDRRVHRVARLRADGRRRRGSRAAAPARWQRRALYKDATVLVLDEATSALDHATEQSVMEAIASLDRSLTIIQIAHRLTTLRNCDFIVEVGEGKVVAQGTYEALMDSSSSFRQMAMKVS